MEYAALPAVAEARDALAADAPLVWTDHGTNVCVDSHAGDAAATDAAFARAAHVVRLDTWVPRVTGVPMEPRAAIGTYDEATGRYTLHAGSGGVVRQKTDLAGALGVPETDVRVVSGEVGGNFGTRNSVYPEFVLVAWAAKRLGRPVKWTCGRRESFLTDYHGRDLMSQAELALDGDGRFLALRGLNTSNVGSHAISFVPLSKGVAVSTSVYHVPAASIRGRAVLTHTSPTTAYRSAGRPEVMFVLERLIDLAARRHGFDRVELRRRNLVSPAAMPYRNPLGLVYDSGDYAAALGRAVALADWAGFEARRAEARRRGRHRGIGIAHYIELNSGAPRERAEITVDPEGRIELVLGTLSAGQGHETSFAQILAEWLGVDLEQVRLVTGDTDRVSAGGGSSSGRSMRLGAVAMAGASDRDRRPRRARRGLAPRGRRGRHRVQARALRREGDRSRGRPLRGRGGGGPGRRPRGAPRAAGGRRRRDDERAVLRLRLRGVRGRDRPGDGHGRDRAVHVGRRRRPRHQSPPHPRPDPRRHRPGRGGGPVGALRLRAGDRAASVRDVHGLRDAARRHAAVVHERDQRGAVDVQSPRPQGW